MKKEPDTREKRWWAILAGLAVLAAACGGSGSDVSEDADAADVATESSVAAPAAETDDTDNEDAEEEAGGDEDGDEMEAAPLEIGGPVTAGMYTTDLLGTPITFDFDRDWIAAAGDPGAMVFVDPATESPTAEVILVTRMNSLAGVGEADVEPAGPAMTGPANDLAAWIEAVGELEADGPFQTDVSGYPTTMFQLTVDPDGEKSIPGGCGPTPDDRCFFVGGTGSQAVAFFIVRTTEEYRMWMIDQGDEDPILITAIADQGSTDWLDDRGEAFVASLTLGEVAPHPVQIPDGPVWEAGFSGVVPAGQQTFPALGGVTMDLPEETFVFQDNNCLTVSVPGEFDTPVGPEVIIALASFTWNNTPEPITTVDELLAIVPDRYTVTENGESITVFDTELAGYTFDDTGKEEGPPALENTFSCAPQGEPGASNASILPGPVGQTYLAAFETGVLVISADGWDSEQQALAQDLLDTLLPTLNR